MVPSLMFYFISPVNINGSFYGQTTELQKRVQGFQHGPPASDIRQHLTELHTDSLGIDPNDFTARG
jgi:hypothetical protein